MRKYIHNLITEQMSGYLWWLVQVVLTVLSAFFAFIGFQVCVASYKLKDPFSFIMTFFASNLIILISVTLFATFIWKMITVYKKLKENV